MISANVQEVTELSCEAMGGCLLADEQLFNRKNVYEKYLDKQQCKNRLGEKMSVQSTTCGTCYC